MYEANTFAFSRAHAAAVAAGAGGDEALGAGLAADCATREASMRPGMLLAGAPGTRSMVRLGIGGLTCETAPPPWLERHADRDEALDTAARWEPLTTPARFERARRNELAADADTLQEPSLGWGGGWGGHAILGYDDVLRDGLGGLARRIDARVVRADAEHEGEAALDWLRAERHVVAGIQRYVANHATEAARLATAATDRAVATACAAVAERCGRLVTEGARDLHDAVQLLWFVHVLDDTDSPGRIDQALLPYFLSIPGTDAERARAARPVLAALWEGFIACRSWNVCLGGVTPDGRDAANGLTGLFLDLQAEYRREAPNLSVRMHAGSPAWLWRRCAEVIGLGTGLPAMFNDAALVNALTDLGIPVEHARDYAMNGCMQVDIQGRSHMGLEDGELNLAKCLELALRAGVSPVTGRQAGARTLPAWQIDSLDTLLAQVRAQIEHCAGALVRSSNLFQREIADGAPHLFRSLFIEDCLGRARDLRRGGPLYNHGQFLTEGVANAGDSVYAIRRLVFEDRRCTLPELVAALDADWADRPDLRRPAEALPRYGNDLDDVDEITAGLVDHWFRWLNTQRTWRGGKYSGGLSVFRRGPGYGEHLAATADGRNAGVPVADSCGPAAGRDRLGPTAMLRSAARLPHRRAASGFALNLKLAPQVFVAPDGAGADRVAALLRGYFDLGGQQVQVNVLDGETLRAAQTDPAAYANLVVRVAGFSARFVDLPRVQQDDIIARTAHAV